jgi:hypothetical protein
VTIGVGCLSLLRIKEMRARVAQSGRHPSGAIGSGGIRAPAGCVESEIDR